MSLLTEAVVLEEHSLRNSALREFYESIGFAGRVGFGERPAMVVIDLARAWTDPKSPPGSDLSGVIFNTAKLLAAVRQAAIPVFFTVMSYDPETREAGRHVLAKTRQIALLVRGSKWVELDPSLGRRPNEPLIHKQRASAFFGTTLLSQLIAVQVDTLIITGCSTSGCIRATAEDSHNNNLRTIVVSEAVGDRSPSAHDANLFDIDARYADVVSLEETLDYVRSFLSKQTISKGQADH